jgi:hypothetical protein
MTAVVRPRGIIYVDATNRSVQAIGVEVIAGDALHVTAVGWEIGSATGSATLFLPPRSRHPQPVLPHDVPKGESGCWMMTRDEVNEALVNNTFGISVEITSARLRPFATINGERVTSSEETNFADI